MRTTTVLRAMLAAGAAFGALALCGSAFAQNPPDPNDALRALVPEGQPGDLDVTEGDAIYKQIASAVGASTDVADFGDGSELTGPCGGFAFSYNGDGPRNHTWTINTAEVSLDSGGDSNGDAKNRNAGLVALGKELPLTFSFKTKVSGDMTSQNLSPCIGNGWVEFEGGFPLATVPGIVGTLFLAGGLIGLLFNSRPAMTWKA